jgi:hypothetical protein
MNEKDTLNNDEKIKQIVDYLKINNEMIDVIYAKLFNIDEQICEKDKKNDLIYKCILPFASYLHFNYNEAQLDRINSSFEKSFR